MLPSGSASLIRVITPSLDGIKNAPTELIVRNISPPIESRRRRCPSLPTILGRRDIAGLYCAARWVPVSFYSTSLYSTEIIFRLTETRSRSSWRIGRLVLEAPAKRTSGSLGRRLLP